ncbi:Putative mitochondrial carrier protein [Septoria linicola]|uniref:Mitochondrial carrier protein n=1 Tax=Septoria linicola TaxID=215465 RepID=A0A9Q9EQC2_9PEZI|nr:putative mitochondrial carrier protein [Septoria linicola]USW58619.1 Putative mitochondrial carrier protein [Septoria linicola]
MSSSGDDSSSSSNNSSNNNNGRSIFYFQPSKKVKQFAKKYRTEISASTSSVFSTFAAFPLDFAKSRMQSYETGFVHTIKDAYRAEGLRAFWRGVTPPLISVTVVRTISFSLYQKAKYAYDAAIHEMTGESPLVIANAPGSYPTLSTMACFGAAGATAGAVITTISCPFELTKLNEQLAGKEARKAASLMTTTGATSQSGAAPVVDLKSGGSMATARRLVRDRGLTGLYAGYRLHLLRDTIGTAIYFTTYESAKQLMGNARGKSATSPYAVLAAGGLCGIVSWACIYPVDVAKTVYQKTLLSAGSGHAARPDIKFFAGGSYRGLGVSVLRSCIINMIFFSNFEFMKRKINALDDD